MIYEGNFKTVRNLHTYNVIIGRTGAVKTITDPQDDSIYDIAAPDQKIVMFGTNPVVIKCNRDDLLKRIIISQATINLVTNDNLTTELFASNDRSIPVTISRQAARQEDDVVVFYGYVDPLEFDEPFAHNWEEISITATDPLGALQNLNVGQLNISSSELYSPYAILEAILDKIQVDIGRRIVNETVWDAFNSTKISMSQFFGESEDDYATLDEVLEEILKYFNMYIAMEGDQLIIISTINHTLAPVQVQNFKDYAVDESTSISVDDVYSQIKLTCEIEPIKDAIISLADDDYLFSNYNHQVPYMTEIVAPGEGERAFNAFTYMIQMKAIKQILAEDDTLTQEQIDAYNIALKQLGTSLTNLKDYDVSYTIDNYCYLLENAAFDFGANGYTNQTFNDQREALLWLANNKFKGAFIGFGRGEKIKQAVKDNSPQSTIKLENWLVISCNGELNDDKTHVEGELANAIQAAQPICTYNRLSSQILSPTDHDVINYLIITGSILLNPLQQKTRRTWNTDLDKIKGTWESGAFKEIRGLFSPTYTTMARDLWHHTVPHPDNDDGAYYTQAWDYPTVPYHGNNDSSVEHPNGLYGYLDNNKSQELQYQYNQNGDSVDKISKIPILACQLQVGDKYCVERLDLGDDGIGIFEWKTQAECTELGIQPYFTIGIDPKIDDYIIGQTFKIANNMDYKKGIDVSGTGIPITVNDHLAGEVHFSILGPYNTIYEKTTKSTHTKFLFWKCTHQHTTDIALLEHISSIMIKDLKFDVKSDNGMRSNYATTADNDLVYASDENPTYIESLEDDIKICTGLTQAECDQFGIKYQVSNSYVLNADNSFFRGFTAEEIKPEVCLVDYLYKEYHNPAKMIETNVKTTIFLNGQDGNVMNRDMLDNAITGIYPNADNPFTIMAYETDIKMQTMKLTLRETNTSTNNQI